MSSASNDPITIEIPELALVVFVGASGAGKSTFAHRHFKNTEILSSDYCRALVSDDELDQAATQDAFDVLHFIAGKRLAGGKLTVIDATNVNADARKPLVTLARRYHCLPVAIVLNLPETICRLRNRERPDRTFGNHVIRHQCQQLRRSLRTLRREGFRHVFTLSTPAEIEAAHVVRQPLWNNRKHEHGPFDIIGDVHGCCAELEQLLGLLGYVVVGHSADTLFPGPVFAHPLGRKAIFVGDLVDRGPRVVDTVRIVRNMVAAGHALCVPGNHDVKLMRKLRGKDVRITHGLEETLAQIVALPEGIPGPFGEAVADFIDSLVSHYVLDDGKLVVAHAGMREEMQGRGSGKVRDFALYGETTGETDEFGLPVRYNWAAEYRGRATVVYGHTPVPQPEWLNRTINIDTGCVFGGKLSALRYPEKELVSVPATRLYAVPAKPLAAESSAPTLSAQQHHDDLLDLEDVSGKRILSTRLHHNVTIREDNAAAALEVMSRFAANPKWLIYLPPTMAPCATSNEPGLLEHPAEAFGQYRRDDVAQVICQKKHMGSRAVVIVCRDENAARERFGIVGEGAGVCYTRTGRRFFDEPAVEADLLSRLRTALAAAGFWEQFQTSWLCLDCELMPWSAKARELLRQQYAAVGSAARAALAEVATALEGCRQPDQAMDGLRLKFADRAQAAARFVDAYRRYCWQVRTIDDLQLAPFHLLASEGAVHVDRDHLWHMARIEELCGAAQGVLVSTPYKVVTLADPASVEEGVTWWTELTEAGGEGMVVKPLDFVARRRGDLIQPAVKCRGREYLRIIYGPDYTVPGNLERLRQRGLGRKRALALREFALGIEALERFVRREPLRRVHECCFGVLALESEPVDPRL